MRSNSRASQARGSDAARTRGGVILSERLGSSMKNIRLRWREDGFAPEPSRRRDFVGSAFSLTGTAPSRSPKGPRLRFVTALFRGKVCRYGAAKATRRGNTPEELVGSPVADGLSGCTHCLPCLHGSRRDAPPAEVCHRLPCRSSRGDHQRCSKLPKARRVWLPEDHRACPRTGQHRSASNPARRNGR